MDPVSDGVLGAWAIAELEGGADFATIFSRFESSSHFWQEVRSAIGAGTGLSNEAGRWIDGMHELMDGPGPVLPERTIYEKFAAGPWGQLSRAIRPYAARAAGVAGALYTGIHELEHVFGGDTPAQTPGQPIPNPTPTTPALNISQGDINIGSSHHGHSFSTAQSMPFGNASYGGRLGGASKFRSGYPANQSRRHTEEFGDLNGHNRIFQFYNYHGEKKQMLDEYCRGLVLSLLRIQKGTVLDYETPIAWPYPIVHKNATYPDVNGVEQPLPTPACDQYLDYLEFHFKDNRRGTGKFGQVLSSGHSNRLAVQYRADSDEIDLTTCVNLWESYVENDVTYYRMKTLPKLAADLCDMFHAWAEMSDDYVRPEFAQVDDLDFVPVRVMLVKKLFVSPGVETWDVVYDDDQLASSRVDVGCYTTVTLHNVSPADGDIVSNPDPLTTDTIAHVPLVGKMYTFSGPVPKVWDKHREELHELFNPDFFKIGRYRLPKSKLEDLQEFKNPPRGRAIWSNCIGESRVMVGPGQIKKLRMNFRVRSSLGEFWQKYRNTYLSDTKMGRSVCICLEPMIRKQHVGEPVSVQLVKRDSDPGAEAFSIIDYPPYEILTDPLQPLAKPRKVLRKLFTLAQDTSGTPTTQFWYHIFDKTGDLTWLKSKTIQTQLGLVHAIDPDGYPIYAGDTPAHNALRTAFDSDSTPGALQVIDPASSAHTVEKWGYTPSGGLVPSNTAGSPILACYPAPWTADPGRTSRGDPMMFNVQINRMLHGSARLKKKHILGADKTGIKRTWNDRMIANLGNVAMFNDDGNLSTDFLKDAPRDIDMMPGAGIQAVIPQGADGNLTVGAPQQAGDINISGDLVTGGGLTQAQAQTAFTAALGSALPTHEGKLLTSDTTAHGHIQGISAPTVNVPAPNVTVQGGLDQTQMTAAMTAALNNATSIDIATAPATTVNVPAPQVTVQGGLDQAQMTNAMTTALNQAANINATVNTTGSPLNIMDMTTAVKQALAQQNVTIDNPVTTVAVSNQPTSMTVNTSSPLNITDMTTAVTAALAAQSVTVLQPTNAQRGHIISTTGNGFTAWTIRSLDGVLHTNQRVYVGQQKQNGYYVNDSFAHGSEHSLVGSEVVLGDSSYSGTTPWVLNTVVNTA